MMPLRFDPSSAALIGDSRAMRELRALIAKVAPSRLPVLIEGPTGAGKEVVARSLHRESKRSGTFVAVNVCAVGDTLFESALFGHVRGAFTGALADSPGYLTEAHGGTLLLDEIGSLPAAAQAKLLRALETGEYRSVGARVDRRSDFRPIAATNESVSRLVASGAFRADLMHRLAGFRIKVPALVERREDIPALAQWFGEVETGPGFTLAPAALDALAVHGWPGNVRELRNVIHRATVLAGSQRVSSGHIRDSLASGMADLVLVTADTQAIGELRILLERSNWNTAAVAGELQINRATVYRRMARLGITPPFR